MTDEELIWEALRLTDARDYSGALALWEKLRVQAPDIESQCTFLLNERRCLSAMGGHDRAQQSLRMAENIDATGDFRLQIELARIDDLYLQEQYEKANDQAKRVLEKHAEALAQPHNADLAWELRYSLARGLVTLGEFEAGLQALSELMPTAQSRDIRRIRYFRALAYQHLKREDEAIDEFKQVVAHDEHDQLAADTHYDLGMIYESRKSFAWAKQHLLAAELLKDLLSVPRSYLYQALAIACESLQQFDEAKKYEHLAESVDR